MIRTLISGSGALGSRHLQAITQIKGFNFDRYETWVYDPNPESLEVAKGRVGELGSGIRFTQNIEDIRGDFDFVISACTSKHRLSSLQLHSQYLKTRFLILEKILFDKVSDFESAENLLPKFSSKTWVNCPMRMTPVYSKLKDFSQSPIHYNVSGTNIRIASNLIHHLDFVAFLTGKRKFKLDLSGVNPTLVPSKRVGYFDFNGVARATFEDGSTTTHYGLDQGTLPLSVEIQTGNYRLISRESEGKAFFASQQENWKWREMEAPIPFQSQMTTQVITSLLENGECPLTPYDESAEIHYQMIQAFSAFLGNERIPFT